MPYAHAISVRKASGKVQKSLGAETVRKANWRATVTVQLLRRGYRLINAEPGNRKDRNYFTQYSIQGPHPERESDALHNAF